MAEFIAAAVVDYFVLSGTAATLVTIATYVVVAAATTYAASKLMEQNMPDFSMTDAAMGGQTKIQFRTDHPRRLIYGNTKLSGPVVFAATSGSGNKYLHLVLVLGEGEIQAIDEIHFGEDNINITSDGTTDANGLTRFVAGSGNRYENLVRVKKHLGSATQVADADLTNDVSEWTFNHRLRGIAYIYIRLEYNQEKLASIPNINAVVRGRKVYDPRLDSTNGGSGTHRFGDSDTWEYSRNPALCIRDFLTSDYGLGALQTEMDDIRFKEQANTCEGTVVINANNDTQQRYTCDGLATLSESPVQIMESMLASCVGSLPYSQGKYQLQVGAVIPASRNHTLDETFLAGGITIQSGGSASSRINSVRGTFMDSTQGYAVVDFAPYKDSTYITEDGSELFADIQFNYVKNNQRAQRIAKLLVERNRQNLVVNLTCNLKAFAFAVNDTVDLSITRDSSGAEGAIFNNKKFRISSWKMRGNGSIELGLVEESSSIYNWNYGNTFGIDIAPNTSLPDPTVVAAPTNVAVSELVNINNDGTTITEASLTWTASSYAFVGQYEVELQVLLSGSYVTVQSVFGGSNITRHDFSGLLVGRQYRGRVRAINLLNIRSDYATSSAVTMVGDQTAPSALTALTATANHKAVTLSWTNPSEADFSGVEFYRATSTGAPSSSTPPTFSVTGLPNRVMQAIDSGLANDTLQRYWVRTKDFTGNASAYFPNNNNGIAVTPTASALDVVSSITVGSGGATTGDITLGAIASISQITTSNNTTFIANGAIEADQIATNAVTADKILAGAVTANKITASSLSAINATIGTLQSAASGARLVIQTDKIQVFDSNNNERVRIGNLS